MINNLETFDNIKSCGENLYKSFQPVRCPYFNELVYFSDGGLEHLKFKRSGVERLVQDQHMRFRLITLAPQVIKLSRTLQGKTTRKGFERIRKNYKNEWIVVVQDFFEFIAILEEVRIRVIVKRINNGSLQFWSIIPYWGEITNKRDFGFGNAQED